ncbi:hypothetical protein [Limosilactobacillus frumenti]|uniref:hypothetical protein n=1 Tax=Limosilactobacillus frumenti TaxID=104955 RepID=UPI0015EC2266|nr:hypothetical protein [Limosilactobacillus frumenti]MBA2914753.1 hypothetical protein [Limosilactobacillus frumenti]
MPKQGHFAKSTRLKQLKQFKVKRHVVGENINDEQFIDYVLVRFALTSKRQLSELAGETFQRFIMEICAELNPGNNDLSKIVSEKLADLQSRVPWQFYQQVLANWEKVQRFLQREVPAVPLKERVLLSNPISEHTLEKLVAELLARQTTTAMFLNQAVNEQIKKQTEKRLLKVIINQGRVDWTKIAALWAPFNFEPADNLDAGTKKWLHQLATLN